MDIRKILSKNRLMFYYCRKGYFYLRHMFFLFCEVLFDSLILRPNLARIAPRKILVVMTEYEGIGDALMCTPAISALKRLYPQASITVFLRSAYAGLFKWNDDVSDLIEYDVKRRRTMRYQFGICRRLAGNRFDLALDLYNHQHVGSAVLAYLSGAPCRIGFNRHHRGFLFTHKVTPRPVDNRYEADQLLDLVRLMGGRSDPHLLKLDCSPENEHKVAEILKASGISAGDCVVCIHPDPSARSREPRRWLPERYALAADRIIRDYGAKVVFTGGGTSKPFIEGIRATMSEMSTSLAGRLTIADLTAMLKRANLVIAPSTGPLHMAVAVGAPTVSIFTHRDPSTMPSRWAGRGARHYVVSKSVDCEGCDWRKCPRFKCVEAVDVDDVLEGVETLRRAGFFTPPRSSPQIPQKERTDEAI
jgi:ADP-heptose:LPS heptosyltransferase